MALECWAVTKRCIQDWCPRSVMFAKAVRNQMVPPSAEWRDEKDNRVITSLGYCPSTASCPVRPHCTDEWRQTKHMQRRSQHLPLRRTGGDHQDIIILHGWRLSSKTWNLTISPLMKRQSARMSKITNEGLTRPGIGCFIAVPMWHHWASKG